MSGDEDEGDEYGLLESYEDRVFLGECISFFIDGTKTEAQGAVIRIFREATDVVWFQVNVMQRDPPSSEWDIVNKSTQVYRYSDKDELLWVRAHNLVRVVPLEFIEGTAKLNKSLIYDEFPLQQRKLMLYYMKGPEGTPGLPMRFKLLWWHFDTHCMENLDWRQRRCLAMNDGDLTSGFVSHLKPLIFDPFVSPLSHSYQHPQQHWNIRTWKLLLRNSVAPVDCLEFELDRLRNPPFGMVSKEEIFISQDCIRILQALLQQWMRVSQDEEKMSPYDAWVFMELHEKFVAKAVAIIAKRKEKEEIAESSGSEVSDLDEHMSFGGEEDSYASATEEEEEEEMEA